MPSLFKGLKDKLPGTRKVDAPSHRERERGRQRSRSSSLSMESSQSSRNSGSNQIREGGRTALSRSRNIRNAVTMSEPFVGPSRKDRAKKDEWDQVYDDRKRRYTDSPAREKSGLKIAGFRITRSPDSKGGKNVPKPSRDYGQLKDDNLRSKDHSITSPRSSRDQGAREIRAESDNFHLHLRVRSSRESRDHDKSREDPRRSREQRSRSRSRSRSGENSPRRSSSHHHRRRRQSWHPKELSRQGSHHRPSHDETIPPIPPISPIPPMTPIPKTRDIFVADKKYNDRAKCDRRKQAERERVERECLRREKEIQEYNERQKEVVAKSAARVARQQTEEETVRRRRNRIAMEKKDEELKKVEAEQRKDRRRGERGKQLRARALSPPKRNVLRLTEENLKAAREEADDFEDGEKTSSLNRPLGDMTRTFIEGMVPEDEVVEAETRKMEQRLRES